MGLYRRMHCRQDVVNREEAVDGIGEGCPLSEELRRAWGAMLLVVETGSEREERRMMGSSCIGFAKWLAVCIIITHSSPRLLFQFLSATFPPTLHNQTLSSPASHSLHYVPYTSTAQIHLSPPLLVHSRAFSSMIGSPPHISSRDITLRKGLGSWRF